MADASSSSSTNSLKNEVWTITWGEATESHVGMQIAGKMADKGFSVEQLTAYKEHFEKLECKCELICLNDKIPENLKGLAGNDPAYCLVIRQGLKAICDYDKLSQELHSTKNIVNKKALMRGVVKNKNARWGYCVNDYAQEPEYEEGKGRIINFAEHQQLTALRQAIKAWSGLQLLGEVNYYYDPKKCYIGYHGDRERRLVIGCRLGESWYLRFKWHYKCAHVGEREDILLNGGDMYIMSEKAVGTDWLKRNSLTLRHAAGNAKFGL